MQLIQTEECDCRTSGAAQGSSATAPGLQWSLHGYEIGAVLGRGAAAGTLAPPPWCGGIPLPREVGNRPVPHSLPLAGPLKVTAFRPLPPPGWLDSGAGEDPAPSRLPNC